MAHYRVTRHLERDPLWPHTYRGGRLYRFDAHHWDPDRDDPCGAVIFLFNPSSSLDRGQPVFRQESIEILAIPLDDPAFPKTLKTLVQSPDFPNDSYVRIYNACSAPTWERSDLLNSVLDPGRLGQQIPLEDAVKVLRDMSDEALSEAELAAPWWVAWGRPTSENLIWKIGKAADFSRLRAKVELERQFLKTRWDDVLKWRPHLPRWKFVSVRPTHSATSNWSDDAQTLPIRPDRALHPMNVDDPELINEAFRALARRGV